jgi:hypothetical protein
MKKLSVIISIFTIIIFNACNTKQVDNAVAFNDSIIKSFDPIIDRMIEFEMAIYDDEADIEKMYIEIKSFSDSVLANVEKMPAFQDGDSLKQRAIDVLKFYNRIITEDYQKIVSILNASDTLSVEAEAFIEFLLRESYKDEGPVMEAFEKEQKNFARRHNFKIENPKTTNQQPF